MPLEGHVRDLDPRDGCGGRVKGLATHRAPCDTLDKAMIMLKDIVEVLNLPNLDDLSVSRDFQCGVKGLYYRQIGAAFINHNPFGNGVGDDGFPSKSPGGEQIASAGTHEIQRLAIAVNCA